MSTPPASLLPDQVTLVDGGRPKVIRYTQAYQQLAVDNASADAQTLMHKGLSRAKRLQFGVSTAPGIFQSFIDARVAGIPGVLPYFDDVLVTGISEEELGLFTLVPGIWPPAAALARLCHSIVMIDNRVTDDP
ncbi:hypothetical protein M514_10268 [Trichuris suis]|uniref:Reverse transcriptase domain-containing protein n=1 Tax=Trichuris suis TaxID=68888 RepID=A0A085MS60_9BILA|nr:hypothetical protein M513_10268 [Trichuris suis]KFD60056.1 hypothetical protein M514_10268 [Trichuris suis]